MTENEVACKLPTARKPRTRRTEPSRASRDAEEGKAGTRMPNTRILVLTAGGIVATCLLAALFGPALWALCANVETLRAAIGGTGAAAPAIMVTAVFVQVVIAFLPGEPLELAAGYLFGPWLGMALCLAGSAAGTLAACVLTRKLGMRFVRRFFSEDEIARASWLADSRRLEAVMFAVFLIPGTPKDLLTYVAALTRCPIARIVAITTVGRIPSVATSTFTADLAAAGSWHLVALALVGTALLVAAGAVAYRALRRSQTG